MSASMEPREGLEIMYETDNTGTESLMEVECWAAACVFRRIYLVNIMSKYNNTTVLCG